MIVNNIKRLSLSLFNQLRVRKNLYRIHDMRAFSILYKAALFEAAQVWPEVLPWSPKSIIDVGAHNGRVAEQLSQLYHPLFIGLVEPLPQFADILKKKFLSPHQHVFECALGRAEGIAYINVLSNLPSSSILKVNPLSETVFRTKMDLANKHVVQLRTLDNIFKESNLKELDLLKIDVQGYEVEVFAGGLNAIKNTRVIVTEVSFFEHYYGQPQFKDIYDYLHINGFEISNMFGYYYDSNNLLIQCDAVFVNRNMKSTK